MPIHLVFFSSFYIAEFNILIFLKTDRIYVYILKLWYLRIQSFSRGVHTTARVFFSHLFHISSFTFFSNNLSIIYSIHVSLLKTLYMCSAFLYSYRSFVELHTSPEWIFLTVFKEFTNFLQLENYHTHM